MTVVGWTLNFGEKDLTAIRAAAEREAARTRREISPEAWGFQQIRTALGAWSRQRETLLEEGEFTLPQQGPAVPGVAATEPKVLKLTDVDFDAVSMGIVGTLYLQVPEVVAERWKRNYAVMVAMNTVWHGAFPFKSMDEWAESLLKDAARASRQAQEAEEERKLIHEVYPELG